MMKLVTALAVVFLSTHCMGFSFWNDFKVTWGYTPTMGYNRLPRNIVDAVKDGWVKVSGEDCKNGGDFNGFRYMHPGDNGIAILFDVSGYAGGFQSIVPHQELLIQGDTTEWSKIPMYQNHTFGGNSYFVITVYFVHPEVLCLHRRASNGNIGASSQVYFQNGHGIKNLKTAYKYRDDAIANGWTINNCIPGMGWHNFYQVDKYEDHNCNRITPTCILYNEFNEMFGFCLTYPGTSTSTRYEHPDSNALKAVLGIAPQCLLDQIDAFGATTIHVYFQNAPWKVDCVK